MQSRIAIGFALIFLLMLAFNGCERVKIDPEAEAILQKLEGEGNLITAKKVRGEIPVDPSDPAWAEAKESFVPLVSQVSVVPRSPSPKKSQIAVRALTNRKEFGLLLSWTDPTKDEIEAASERFRDAVAVGFPMNYGATVPLPYIGMGNKGRPVNIWHWKASWQADVERGYQGTTSQYPASVRDQEKIRHLTGEEAGSPLSAHDRKSPVENLLAEGFGTLTSVKDESLLGKGIWKDGKWMVVIKGTFKTSKESGILPVTFAVWDGSAGERNGLKGVTRWRFLKLEGKGVSTPYLKSFIVGPIPGADPTRGRQLVSDMGCISCHNLPGKAAVNDVGPDLTLAGAMHRPEYLLESMKDPNAVIIPAPGYFDPKTWSSTMPSFGDQIPEKDYNDVVEYLRSLQ
jgi:complex iron-sulfur molybdoenzyme family reductase subunit gamma